LLFKKFDLRVIHILEKTPVNWEGKTGYFKREMLEEVIPPELPRNQVVNFLCTPLPLMRAANRIVRVAGI